MLAKSQPILTMCSVQRASPSKLYPASQKSADLNCLYSADSQSIQSISTCLDRLQKFQSQSVQITSCQLSPSELYPASREQVNLDRFQIFESQPVQIPSNYKRASMSRSYLASREPAHPDHIQPTHLDCFQQVESPLTQIASSQLGLLTNSSCESHTQAKCHNSLIMTEKDHLPTNEHSVNCHSKMVRTTINQ